MVKIICDGCGKEIPHGDFPKRFKRISGEIIVEVLVAVGEVWNAGHVCHDCVKRIVASGDPYPPEKR